MIIEHLPIAIEGISAEFIGTEGLFCLLGFLCLLALPFDIVGSVVRIAHVFDRFEVVRSHPRLDISLQLSWFGFNASVLLPVPLGNFIGIGFLFILVGRFVEKRVGCCGVELLLVDLQLADFMVLLDKSLGLLDVLISSAGGCETVERAEEGLIHLA
jgi:hypothetical protein